MTPPTARLTDWATPRQRRQWFAALDEFGSGQSLVGDVAARVAMELGLDPSGFGRSTVEPSGQTGPAGLMGLPEPPGGWANPWLVGAVYEQSLDSGQRKGRGAWYTPRHVVDGLIAFAAEVSDAAANTGSLPALEVPPEGLRPDAAKATAVAAVDRWDRVIDPTCGGGAFVLGALEFWKRAGWRPAEAAAKVAGMDIDPGAVRVCRWSVALWLAANGVDPASTGVSPEWERSMVVVDSLNQKWPAAVLPPDRPVLVAGNPPFISPLKSQNYERSEVLGPYADAAAQHLLHAVDQLSPGSNLVFVQPQSVLSGRDTAQLRCHLTPQLAGLWVTPQAVFDASVRVCAPVFHAPLPAEQAQTRSARVVLATEPEVVAVAPVASGEPGGVAVGPWGRYGAAALGAPPLPSSLADDRVADAPRLGELVEATAGFRDEHYGLAQSCRELVASDGAAPNGAALDGDEPHETAPHESDPLGDARHWHLVTVGAIDPLWCWWGQRHIRFAGRTWSHPVIDPAQLAAASPKVLRWAHRQLRPKVVLATQSKVLEPYIDRAGQILPATPAVAVHTKPEHLDMVAAVLLAPPVALWAWGQWFGSAMVPRAIKLAARQVGELPLPPDTEAWAEAARLVAAVDQSDPAAARAGVQAVGRAMNQAYGGSEAIVEWWLHRLNP